MLMCPENIYFLKYDIFNNSIVKHVCQYVKHNSTKQLVDSVDWLVHNKSVSHLLVISKRIWQDMSSPVVCAT